METFLQKTANYLAAKYPDHISELCIVLPNRRAGLFFKRYLGQASGKAIWSPDIFSSEDFIANISGLEIIDQLNQLFELYNVYRKSKGKDAEAFEEFSKWAITLLADFNEVDRYMADGNKLFSNLGDIREIENWSLGQDDLTDFQTKYISFWDSIGNYYRQFTHGLLNRKKAYPGLAYRYCAENISELIKHHNWHRIIFAGFNALTVAEERIIRTLVEMEKAEALWDADSYYVKNRNHEAGRFIRKYKTLFDEVTEGVVDEEEPRFLWEEDNLSTSPKHIEVIGVARNVAQAKVTGDIIANLRIPEPEMENTAIVLADENLLFPVLHSLPRDVKDVNVTMGFPFRNTPVAGLFELLFNLHENPMRFGKNSDRFYHRDLIKFLSHPYINHLFRSNNPVNRHLASEVQKRNAVFVSVDRLQDALEEEHHRDEFEVLKPLFTRWNNVNDALEGCYALINALKKALVKQNDKMPNLELEFVYTYAKILKRIRTLMEDYGHITKIKTLHSIISQAVYSTTLPFYGEPLRGLQVMGMLETRALDFETVILLSVNESILPSGRSQNSFIPYDLKRVFGLPTHSDRDAVFAYHFYRLLQRARTVYLLYNTETDTMGSGEKSRFITQLLHELPQVNKQAVIKERLLDISAQTSPAPGIVIEKTPDILEKIKLKGVDGFSPSLLNTYKYCPLQFYFQLVAGLREQVEVEETIKADTLGTVIHNVLEELYKPYIGQVLEAVQVEEMKRQVDDLTESIFSKSYYSSDLRYGKNLLILKVALKFIHNLLDREAEFLTETSRMGWQLKIKELEQELNGTVDVEVQKDLVPVKIKGKVDRVDMFGSITRIIDYKTGVVDNKELAVKEWPLIINDPDLGKSFQLLMYALMYYRLNPQQNTTLQSGIITFRQLSAGVKSVTANGTDILNEETLLQFEDQLRQLLKEIYDPSVPFRQTENLRYCGFCSYRSICNR